MGSNLEIEMIKSGENNYIPNGGIKQAGCPLRKDCLAYLLGTEKPSEFLNLKICNSDDKFASCPLYMGETINYIIEN